VSNYTIALADISLLKDKIDKGCIIILCLDMFYIEAQASEPTMLINSTMQWPGLGHFMLLKDTR